MQTQSAAAIVEQTTAEFRRDWDRLNSASQAAVREALNGEYSALREDRRGFRSKLFQPQQIQLKGGLGSSLYSMRVGRGLRVVLTVDDDPVFGRTLVTLFRVVPDDERDRAYRSTAQLLYKGRTQRHNGA